MPINRSMMSKLGKQYGKGHGKQIYYAMENKMRNVDPRKATRVFGKKKK